MARPKKNNAEYFSHDADMRNDVKIKALRRKFSHTGYAVWCFLLETLTDSENFEINYDEVDKELLAADFDISVNSLTEFIDYCIKINLIQLSSENKLYSEAHKLRFSGLLSKRERDRERLQNYKSKDKKTITEEKNNYRTDNTHSKVKESILEESKGKESKEILYPYQDIADLWNSICISLPKVKLLNDSRRRKIKSRLDEIGGDTKEARLINIKRLFSTIQNSDFLRGENKNNWQASFDWVFDNPTNWVKIIEGNYEKEKQVNKSGLNIKLGTGEYINNKGIRTYGSGQAVIPDTAPPRPNDKSSWDSNSSKWIML